MCSKCPKAYGPSGSTGNKALGVALMFLGVQQYKNCSCACAQEDIQVSTVAPQQNRGVQPGQVGNTGAQIDTVAYCKKCQHTFLMGMMNIS